MFPSRHSHIWAVVVGKERESGAATRNTSYCMCACSSFATNGLIAVIIINAIAISGGSSMARMKEIGRMANETVTQVCKTHYSNSPVRLPLPASEPTSQSASCAHSFYRQRQQQSVEAYSHNTGIRMQIYIASSSC